MRVGFKWSRLGVPRAGKFSSSGKRIRSFKGGRLWVHLRLERLVYAKYESIHGCVPLFDLAWNGGLFKQKKIPERSVEAAVSDAAFEMLETFQSPKKETKDGDPRSWEQHTVVELTLVDHGV